MEFSYRSIVFSHVSSIANRSVRWTSSSSRTSHCETARSIPLVKRWCAKNGQLGSGTGSYCPMSKWRFTASPMPEFVASQYGDIWRVMTLGFLGSLESFCVPWLSHHLLWCSTPSHPRLGSRGSLMCEPPIPPMAMKGTIFFFYSYLCI